MKIRYFGLWKDEKQEQFIVTEFVDGGSLSLFLRDNGDNLDNHKLIGL